MSTIKNNYNYDELLEAFKKNDVAKFKALNKETIDAINSDTVHFPLLSTAAYCGNPEIARILLEKGVNPNKTNSEGFTAGHHAAAKNNMIILKLLATYGANFNIYGPDGKTVINYIEDNNFSNPARKPVAKNFIEFCRKEAPHIKPYYEDMSIKTNDVNKTSTKSSIDNSQKNELPITKIINDAIDQRNLKDIKAIFNPIKDQDFKNELIKASMTRAIFGSPFESQSPNIEVIKFFFSQATGDVKEKFTKGIALLSSVAIRITKEQTEELKALVAEYEFSKNPVSENQQPALKVVPDSGDVNVGIVAPKHTDAETPIISIDSSLNDTQVVTTLSGVEDSE